MLFHQNNSVRFVLFIFALQIKLFIDNVFLFLLFFIDSKSSEEHNSTVLLSSFQLFSMNITFQPNMSAYRVAVQKNIREVCFNCGSSQHKVNNCNRRLNCSHCGRSGHVKKACGYPFMPCHNCGQMGHDNISSKECPLRKKTKPSSSTSRPDTPMSN